LDRAARRSSTLAARRTKLIVMDELRKLLATAEPPELGPGPRAGVQPESVLTKSLDQALPKRKGDAEQLLRALVLLWHDHLDSAHAIAQSIENADGAFVHGIVHRREPDYGNATYWFRRVGQHPAFPEIARRAQLLEPLDGRKGLALQLMSNCGWNPYAFITACEKAAQNPPDDAWNRVLRQVQRIESEALMEWLLQQK
jgi:hypothetical protein